MAMTGGTAKLVKTSTTSVGTTLKLYVYYKTSQNIETNKSTVNCGMYITLSAGSIGPWTDSNGSYLGNTSNTFTGSIPNTNGKLEYWIVENKSFTVNHNADGTGSATIYWKWGVNSSWGGMVKPSGYFTITLPTIPRASSITSVGNITLGKACSVKWTPASKNFKYKLKFSLGTWDHTTDFISPGTTSAYTYTGYKVPANDTLYNLIPKATGQMSVTLTTYNSDGNKIGSTSAAKTFTVTVPNTVVPTMGNIILSPGDFLVQGKNKLTISVSGCKAGTGSSIKSYIFTGPGISSTTTSTSVTSKSVISDVGELSYTVKVTDNRDRTATKTVKIICHPYSVPYFKSFNAYRVALNNIGEYVENESGEYIKCDYTVVYSYVNNNNGIMSINVDNGGAGTVSYEDLSDIEENNGIATVTGGAIIEGARPEMTYKIYATVKDEYSGGNTSAIKTIFSQSRILNIRADGSGMALGKMAEFPDLFDVAWGAHFRKDLFVGDYKLNAVKPYYEKGDTTPTVNIHTAGFLTSDRTSVQFIIPLSKPVIGNPSISINTVVGYLLRQGRYTHGSSYSNKKYIIPLSQKGTLSPCGNFIYVAAKFDEDTSATNNDTIGVDVELSITFS